MSRRAGRVRSTIGAPMEISTVRAAMARGVAPAVARSEMAANIGTKPNCIKDLRNWLVLVI